MNIQIFSSLLSQLDEAQWQAMVDGSALLMVDDVRLEAGPAHSANAIVKFDHHADVASLRAETLLRAEALLSDYYRTHPLTRSGFAAQGLALFGRYGEQAFAAVPGALPERTLFVEGGELVAEGRDSPRHRYGAFCEIDNGVDRQGVEVRVRQWLDSGAAHERYLEMNVCRYTC